MARKKGRLGGALAIAALRGLDTCCSGVAGVRSRTGKLSTASSLAFKCLSFHEYAIHSSMQQMQSFLRPSPT